MSRKSDNFPLVFLGGGLGFWLLFHAAWNIVFEDWLKHQLEHFFGHTVAEMIERFGAVGFPALAAMGIVWFLLRYAKAHYASISPDPMVEAQRQHTAAILAQTEAWKTIGPADTQLPNTVTREEIIRGEDWQLAEHAVENFSGVHLVDERNKWREMFQESYLAGHEAQDKISSLQNAMGGILGVDGEGQLEASRRKLQVSAMQYDMAKDELKRAWDSLRDDIELKLANGTLIAKGFRSPHASGNVEVAIASAEWRVLILNNAKSEALSKGSGEVLYSGLLIGKSG